MPSTLFGVPDTIADGDHAGSIRQSRTSLQSSARRLRQTAASSIWNRKRPVSELRGHSPMGCNDAMSKWDQFTSSFDLDRTPSSFAPLPLSCTTDQGPSIWVRTYRAGVSPTSPRPRQSPTGYQDRAALVKPWRSARSLLWPWMSFDAVI